VRLRSLSCLVLILAAPVHAFGNEPSCKATAGTDQAKRYVAMCLQVSPATHPPCNFENPCALIIDEIKRGCAMLTQDAPPFCRHDPPR
jgi:hypothetical protein